MNAPVWDGAYLLQARKPVSKGMQSNLARLPSRRATCEEVACEWFMFGKAGVDARFPFAHQAGVQCGDFSKCLPCESPIREKQINNTITARLCGACMPCKVGTSNCPCADRKHRMNDERFPVKYNHDSEGTVRQVVESEFIDRTGDGMHALNHIKTRGL